MSQDGPLARTRAEVARHRVTVRKAAISRPGLWATISEDGHWIRCPHRRCGQALGSVPSWIAYEPEGLDEPYLPTTACRIPGALYVLGRGWERSSEDGWTATPRCVAYLRQQRAHGDRNAIGLPGRAVFSIQGSELPDRNARRYMARTTWQQLRVELEPVERITCAMCGEKVKVDMRRMTYWQRPLSWAPGTPQTPALPRS